MRLLAAALLLAALGCNRTPTTQGSSTPDVAGLIAVPYVRPAGLPPQVPQAPPVTFIKLVARDLTAPVGLARLTVQVLDAFDSPVPGASVSFSGSLAGLGTATTDASGTASVAAILVQGPAIVSVTAGVTYASAHAWITATGQ